MGHRLTWDDIRKSVSRFTVDELLSAIIRTIELHQCVIFVDSLARVPPTYIDVLQELTRHTQNVSARDIGSLRNRAEMRTTEYLDLHLIHTFCSWIW